MRVLVVKTSSMGDVLHTLPALTDAMQAMPDIRFDWVVEEGFAQIPSWHPAVERVLPVAIRRWRKAWFSAPVKAERRAFRDALRAVNYDAVIDAQGLVKSAALVTRLARGVKHGMDWQTAREPLASLSPPSPYCESAARGGTHPRTLCEKPRLCKTRRAGRLRHRAALFAPGCGRRRALCRVPARHHAR